MKTSKIRSSKLPPQRSFFLYDILILTASLISLLLSVYLWFVSSKDQGVFVGLWVPSVISIGIYIRIMLKERL